jgi:rhodanese-related sulfurtransferase
MASLPSAKTHRLYENLTRAARQSAMILVLATAVGLMVNHLRGDTLQLVADWSPEARIVTDSGESLIVSLEEARTLCMEGDALFLDARAPEDYARGHIQCAQNIPWQSFESYIELIWDTIPDDAWVVTYCDGEHCTFGEDLARELRAMGYNKAKVLINGWTRWLEAGLPVAL